MTALLTAPRLFSPDASLFDRPELNFTLPQAFQLFAVTRMLRHRTAEKARAIEHDLKNFRVVIRRWENLMGDVPIGEIDDALLAEWRDRLLQFDGVNSVQTVRKHWRYLRRVLKVLARSTPDEPAVIDFAPERLDMPRFVKQPGRVPVISRETWDAFWRGASCWLLSTSSLPGPFVGRGMLMLFFSTGLRAGDAWSVQWESLTLAPHCPIQDVAFLENEHGWLQQTCAKTHKVATIPLTPCLRRWIDRARELLPPKLQTGQLLPVGCPSTQSKADKRRQAARWALMAAAGTHEYQFRDFRPAANNAWNAAKWGAGAWLLGHAANRDVNSQHYTNGIPILLEAVANLKIPHSFLHGEL